MAFNDVDICNLALARLGDQAEVSSINPPDESVQANYCARFYPLAVQTLIDLPHNWSFSIVRVTLASITNTANNWDFAFSTPSDMNNIVALYDADGNQLTSYAVETVSGATVIYADCEVVQMTYSSNGVTSGVFPPAFVNALSAVLAGFLAGVILKGDVGAAAAQRIEELSRVLIAQAVHSDAQNSSPHTNYVPASALAATPGGLTLNGELGGPVVYPPSGYTVL